jgi:hypothetical protein
MIYNTVRKLHSTESVLDKSNLKRDVLTEENLDDIGTRLEASPKNLLALTAHFGTKLLKLRPYKTIVVHSLLPPYGKAKIHYCMWFQELVFNGLLDPELRFFSDKAWFTLSGYVMAKITEEILFCD